MTNRKTDNVLNIDLDSSELLILNGGVKTEVLSSEDLRSGMQNGTKVGAKPVPPGAPTRKSI